MNTLKCLIYTIVFMTTAASSFAQSYNNIEFVENKGQWDERVRYKGDVDAGSVFIRSTGFTILKHNPEDYAVIKTYMHDPNEKALASLKRSNGEMTVRSHAYNVDFVGASPSMQVVADKGIDTYNNYFIGNDPSKWGSQCRIFQGITLSEVYPHVDVRYYTYNGTLKYDIIARPGADIKKIALKYDGVDRLQVKDKELVVSTSVGELKESYPYTFQSDAKGKRNVNCKYVVKGNIVRFEVEDYDPKSTLVIDPSLVFCSLSGSPANNWGFTATFGPDGSFFGGGIVFSDGFPVSTGAFQTTWAGGTGQLRVDIGIIRLTANGGNRMYATYIGGSGNEQPHSLIVDPSGNLYVAGRTNSPNYPTVGAQPYAGQGYDIVVTKLNSNGTGPLLASVRIGGSLNDGVNIKEGRLGAESLEQNYGDDGRSEVILDRAGNVYVASCSRSADFPTSAGAYQTALRGEQDAVVVKFDPNLNRIFSTYLGGDRNDAAYVLSISPNNGEIFVGGGTDSKNFLQGTQAGTVGPSPRNSDPNSSDVDGFVARLSPDGSAVLGSAYIGTPSTDQVYGVQFDKLGYPYIMGQTRGNWQVINAEYSNAGGKQFIAKLQPDLSSYIYSTMFGAPGSVIPNISPTAFLVDRCENVYVSGWGGSVDAQNRYPSAGTGGLPVTGDAYKPTTDNKDFYFFVLRKNAAGTDPLYASFFGQDGGFTDHVDGGTSRFDLNGVIYQGVCANCSGGVNFPTTAGAWARVKPASANCNLGMIKMSFNLAGVAGDVLSTIGGVPNDTAGCLPLEVTFTDQVRNAIEYIWDFGDNSPRVGPVPAADGYSVSHEYTTTGVFRVMLIAINPNSCNVRDTSYMNIRVSDLRADLAADFQKLNGCASLTYQFNNLTTTTRPRPFTNTSFIWDFDDGSARVTTGFNPVTHTFPSPGPYNVRLVLNDTAFCNHPDSITIPLRIAENVDARFTTDPAGCAPHAAVFTNESAGGVTYQWDFGDPTSPDNTSTEENPTHVYANPGTYTVTFTVTDPFTCNITDVATTVITVYDAPTAAFTYTPTIPIVNTPYVFSNVSSADAVRFKWVFDDGDSLETTSRADITHQYVRSGFYNVCLTAYNAGGCSHTVCQRVEAIIDPLLDVPNAFTPNSGDINSVVQVQGFGIVKMKFIIYNRWGKKVFESTSQKIGWDGKVNGALQPMDVYAYTLEAEFDGGKKVTKTGDITLIR